jgi:glutamine amidotransferase
VGNLFSLCCSLSRIGANAKVTSDPEEIRSAEKIILPGVGAFADAAKKLRDSGLDKVILEQASAGKEIMGICLGMQLLFEKSYEFGEHTGLGLLKGSVIGMEGTLPPELKIPHIGWNGLYFQKESKLLKYIKEGDCVYFVHSFYVDPSAESVVATAEYGKFVTAAVQSGNVMGCQFHPEKSGEVGLNILRAFCEKEEKV